MTSTLIINSIAAIATDAHATIDDALAALDMICDAIIECADDITTDDALTIMRYARIIDATDSNFAAEIRDTLRDNIDNCPSI